MAEYFFLDGKPVGIKGDWKLEMPVTAVDPFRNLAQSMRNFGRAFSWFPSARCQATIRETSLEILDILPTTSEGDELGKLLVGLAAEQT